MIHSVYKRYDIQIDFEEDGVTLFGVLTCYGCGSIEDPLSVYDMTLVMW